ncbi:hypothetical protein VNO77_34016 [Canavalia gladiata]|uniref:Uncharacterized protein n=1 Tax=Canavalia gladiata TaxID=3824 RepID=A0AAN9Q1D8_CANGL
MVISLFHSSPHHVSHNYDGGHQNLPPSSPPSWMVVAPPSSPHKVTMHVGILPLCSHFISPSSILDSYNVAPLSKILSNAPCLATSKSQIPLTSLTLNSLLYLHAQINKKITPHSS